MGGGGQRVCVCMGADERVHEGLCMHLACTMYTSVCVCVCVCV